MYNKLSSFLRGCGILFLASILFAGTANAAGNTEVDWETWSNSVIRLVIVDKQGLNTSIESGTAFAINDQGDYITNHHVIKTALEGGELRAVESLKPKKIHNVKIVWQSEEHDLAMVHVETWKNKALVLSSGDMLKKGQDVYSVGFPGAADHDNPAEFNVSTLKKGVFSAFKNFPLMKGGRDIKMIEHDAPVNSGNSGGPLADACRRVIAINEQKALSESDANGSVNIAEGILSSINTVELMALLEQHHVKYQRDDTPCVGSPAAAQAVADAAAQAAAASMIIAGVVALLAIIGFALIYRRVQRANNGQFNTRVLSRMIRDRVNGGGHSGSGGQPPPVDHRDEQNPQATPAHVPQPSALYRLVPQRSDLGLPTLTLPAPGNYRLGRRQAANTQLVVPNQYVSGEHLLITVNPDHSVVVEDLGGTNGTHIAGVALTRGQLQPLQVGQTLRLGHDEVIYSLQRG